VDLNTPRAMPVHRVPSALVYNASAGEVDTVIVDGQILMRAREILCVDEKALLAEARAACARLFERAGVVIGSAARASTRGTLKNTKNGELLLTNS
jgi:5-methylthioadenosine/S-adenosylhomocysteine deaminase